MTRLLHVMQYNKIQVWMIRKCMNVYCCVHMHFECVNHQKSTPPHGYVAECLHKHMNRYMHNKNTGLHRSMHHSMEAYTTWHERSHTKPKVVHAINADQRMEQWHNIAYDEYIMTHTISAHWHIQQWHINTYNHAHRIMQQADIDICRRWHAMARRLQQAEYISKRKTKTDTEIMMDQYTPMQVNKSQ